MLSDRRQRVLAALIEEYVAKALPVGSRTLMEHYGLGVSSATIRNELSALEDEGYLSQPHTSAGRVPTDIGYRAFVDNLVATGAINDEELSREDIESLRTCALELDTLLAQTSAALARLTDCLSIVMPHDVSHSRSIGMSALMRQPEFASSLALLPIMQVLEDDTILLHILDSTAPAEKGPAVRIGSENESDQLSGVSVVAARYGAGDDEGIVAVIGPTRMNYTRVLQAVRIATRTLGNE
ncbi:MAG: heat-inducible transcription repressor HrcA [Eggerthellaceae bacterium]|nr:heat-inducible transcription repressor HrcA [Eggerthellaceae bacterium]